MVRIKGSTVIARPVGEVFGFVADEHDEPKYHPRMVRVEKITGLKRYLESSGANG